ncbi:MAG: glucoamylase family protein [Betaproteobacteria bacterium]
MTELHARSDEALLDQLQRNAFGYFIQRVNPANGLIADTSREESPASIAVVGFALSVYPVGVERGWIKRADAVDCTLVTLRWFWNSDQSGHPDATGYKGFFYHFLDMKTGLRVWRSELSLIDTALLLAGALTAGTYFSGKTENEAEIRELADALYQRVDWQWAQTGTGTVWQGWKPECGFLNYGWEGYSEAIILYVLGLGSPTHTLAQNGYHAWTATYQWENLYGYDFLYAGPLFIHQFSHAWIDFRGLQDRFMREKKSDYFNNSRQATYIQREYALRNPNEFDGYGANGWGLSAGDGPGNETRRIGGRVRRFAAYAARGVPFGWDDGTVAPAAALASLPFAPEIVMPAVRHLHEKYPELEEVGGLSGGFNPTFRDAAGRGWHSAGTFGLDQGIAVMMIENHRTQFYWKLMRECPAIKTGLRRAGFAGNWL